jgi:hypothetical protein
MKKRSVIVSVIVSVILILLLLGMVVGVMAAERGPGAQIAVRPGTAVGGRYQLAGLSWQANSTTGGGDYRLTAIFAPSLTGNGCCCTYLPRILR